MHVSLPLTSLRSPQPAFHVLTPQQAINVAQPLPILQHLPNALEYARPVERWTRNGAAHMGYCSPRSCPSLLPSKERPQPGRAGAFVDLEFPEQTAQVIVEVALADAHAAVDGEVLLLPGIGDAAPYFALGGRQVLQARRGLFGGQVLQAVAGIEQGDDALDQLDQLAQQVA